MEDQNKTGQDNQHKGPISSGVAPGPGEHLLDPASPAFASARTDDAATGIGGGTNFVDTGNRSATAGGQDAREWRWPRSEDMQAGGARESGYGSRTMLDSVRNRVRGSQVAFLAGTVLAGFLLQRVMQVAPAQRLSWRGRASGYDADESLESEREYGLETAYAPETAGTTGTTGTIGATGGTGASSRMSALSGRMSQLGDRVKQAQGNARESLRATTEQARTRLQDMGERTKYQYSRARDRVGTMKEEQPLLIGALGVAIGAGLGAVLAMTRRENELMGDVRDKVVGKARQTAMQQMQSVKESAQRIADFAKQEAMHKKDELSASGIAGSGTTGQGAR
ncbi:hypothetical protein [Noviherbaspirillum aridicola]|uniref:DUF3618 domain-containing protein n=1 Tax=Noviherbaspirillum aridicola TaxID=2849687 RepID=A0ABQ4PZZ0_9BURK|nr:hypothetical protein [Noviherbaspirillum aridicola]GIZ50065.1 hypothetical protein NCCP691_00790 [Noviherbaspirillum aridicola]